MKRPKPWCQVNQFVAEQATDTVATEIKLENYSTGHDTVLATELKT